MPVYVDELKQYPNKPFGYEYWCHMYADTLQELHTMAENIGLQRKWFQDSDYPHKQHYDLIKSKRELAIRFGAIPQSYKDWLRENK